MTKRPKQYTKQSLGKPDVGLPRRNIRIPHRTYTNPNNQNKEVVSKGCLYYGIIFINFLNLW